MIIVGIILLVLGWVFAIKLLFDIGAVLLAIGALLFIFGAVAHPIGGRRHWW